MGFPSALKRILLLLLFRVGVSELVVVVVASFLGLAVGFGADIVAVSERSLASLASRCRHLRHRWKQM